MVNQKGEEIFITKINEYSKILGVSPQNSTKILFQKDMRTISLIY